jgi:hypothetical protein
LIFVALAKADELMVVTVRFGPPFKGRDEEEKQTE